MLHDIEGVAFDLDGTFYPNYRLNIRLVPFLVREWRLLAAFGRARNIIRAGQERDLRNAAPGPQGAPVNAGEQAGESALGKGETFYDVQARIAARLLNAPGGALVKQRIETLIYRGWGPLFKKIRPFPHVRETIAALREAGLKLGLLSDFPPELKLEYLGLDGVWDAVLCSERENYLKPHPKPFLSLARAMGLPPGRILYVGNSRRYDAEGARRAGMKSALIKPFRIASAGGAAGFIFTDYRQLRKYVLTYYS
ncbi:MAG: HAD family hydrolase [Treponema sp.]|jgi:putative hydrolase of the HAD superfamily|nr:HAD family hydrolase [Treponema sp.]